MEIVLQCLKSLPPLPPSVLAMVLPQKWLLCSCSSNSQHLVALRVPAITTAVYTGGGMLRNWDAA